MQLLDHLMGTDPVGALMKACWMGWLLFWAVVAEGPSLNRST